MNSEASFEAPSPKKTGADSLREQGFYIPESGEGSISRQRVEELGAQKPVGAQELVEDEAYFNQLEDEQEVRKVADDYIEQLVIDEDLASAMSPEQTQEAIVAAEARRIKKDEDRELTPEEEENLKTRFQDWQAKVLAMGGEWYTKGRKSSDFATFLRNFFGTGIHGRLGETVGGGRETAYTGEPITDYQLDKKLRQGPDQLALALKMMYEDKDGLAAVVGYMHLDDKEKIKNPEYMKGQLQNFVDKVLDGESNWAAAQVGLSFYYTDERNKNCRFDEKVVELFKRILRNYDQYYPKKD